MRAEIRADSSFKLTNGAAPVEIHGKSLFLPFDSGANLSVVTRSKAIELGLRILEPEIQVGAIAGNKVPAHPAVADSLSLGSAKLRHVVFLVFEDRDLFISEANFQIHGLIGFPVILALREVTFGRDGEVKIASKPGRTAEQNMCLDGLNPLVSGVVDGKRLTFVLDTGATHSMLYPPFFAAFEDRVKRDFPPHTERVRGVGGFREIKGYLGKDLAITIGGKEARFPTIPILTEPTTSNSRYLHGNLGQDLIRQFSALTLNFEAMRATLE
jgi:hypothetical protein